MKQCGEIEIGLSAWKQEYSFMYYIKIGSYIRIDKFQKSYKQIFSSSQIFRAVCVVHSDSNVGPVHWILTRVKQKFFPGSKKNRIINTQKLMYINTYPVAKKNVHLVEKSINCYKFRYRNSIIRDLTEIKPHQSNMKFWYWSPSLSSSMH